MLYKEEFDFLNFYSILLNNNIEDSIYSNFLKSAPDNFITSNFDKLNIETKTKDLRIDLPVWFGDIHSKNRILIFGMEPRDTDKKFNIEKVDNRVFAVPFALESGKGKYYRSFLELLKKDVFIYFTDIVKDYEVKSKVCKKNNDLNARKLFTEKANGYKDFLKKEMSLLNPSIIIALGNETEYFLKNFLEDEYKKILIKITHPAAWHGGVNKAISCINREIIPKLL